MSGLLTIIQGDALDVLKTLPDESVHCCVTSPPYWGLRDYGTGKWEGGSGNCDHKIGRFERGGLTSKQASNHGSSGDEAVGTCPKCGAIRKDRQIGLEATPQEYVAKMVDVFREVRRVLREDGTCWVNLGSSYAGYWGDNYAHKPFGEDRTADGSTPPNKPSMNFRKPSASRGKQPIQSRSGVPACGSDGRELQDSTASDCACSCLCDGCRDALGLTHNENICPLHGQSASLACTTNHDSGRSDSSTMPQDASLPDAQESTMRQSSPPHQGGCLHCSNCGACLSVLRSSSRDARLCVRNSCLNHTIVHPVFKPKDMVPIPWMVAMALQQDGWWLRQDIIWHKPNPMPESVTDRCTKAHEYLFLLAKSNWYYYDAEAIKEQSIDPESLRPEGRNPRGDDKFAKAFLNEKRNGMARTRDGFSKLEGVCYPTRNRRSVWTVPTAPYSEAHFATFPPDLIKPCILAGCPVGGTVIDVFGGSGTTGMVALELGRKAILIELNPKYVKLAEQRCDVTPGLPFNDAPTQPQPEQMTFTP